MTNTINGAKETIVFFVNENGFPEESTYYDFVMKFEDTDITLSSEYHEDIDEETGEDNSKWKLRYQRLNRRAELLNDEFDTEEEAEDEIFDRIVKFDFEKSCENTCYFDSEEECEDWIVDSIKDEERIDFEVAKSIYRKSKIVFERRQELKMLERQRIFKQTSERKAFLEIAVPAEVARIKVDEDFKAALLFASEASGIERNNRHASAMKALLERNGIEKITSDFWQVFRMLKANAERKEI